MSYSHCSLVHLKYLFEILIILNHVSQFDCSNILNNELNSLLFKNESLLDLTKIYSADNLLTLPKNYVFTDEEVSKDVNLYLQGQKNEDMYLNGTQLIQKYGYNVEEHHVTTIDGYILGLYRIPGKGRVVFLMHGLSASFVDWLTVGPDQALPYLLAAQGYDVWMGNARGNTFSKKHNRLSTSDPAFWDFSFHEIGSMDLPATIDYILEKTGKKKLTYIGHSQGTTVFFVLCSTKPEYNDKIDFMVALAPVAWMKHVPNPLIQLAGYNHDIIYALGTTLGANEIAPDNDFKKLLTLSFCGNSLMASIVCQNAGFIVAGFDYSQMNYRQLPVMFQHFPAGCSLKQMEHYAQLLVSGYFRNFDYGFNLNLKKYGLAYPPSYPVDKIGVPIALFYSQGDWLVSPIDVENLRSKLINVVEYYKMPLPNFNHLDYLWGKDVKRLLYDKILTLIAQNFM